MFIIRKTTRTLKKGIIFVLNKTFFKRNHRYHYPPPLLALLLLLVITTTLIAVINFYSASSADPEELQQFIVLKRLGWKTVNIWGSHFWHIPVHTFRGYNLFDSCKERRCVFTTDKSFEELSDAIVVPWSHVLSHSTLPKMKTNQVRIFYTIESPATDDIIHGDIARYERWNNFFNLTMTYRGDSDILNPYARIAKRPTSESGFISKGKFRAKSRFAAAFISNCKIVTSGRAEMIRQIQRYVPLDVYGYCGTFSCPRENEEKCWMLVEKKYKFYFALENSICRDYVTEKLFHALKRDVIPVAYGGGNYKAISPPKSMIDISTFDDVRHLSEFMINVSKSYEEYNSYFRWKRDYQLMDGTPDRHFCELCNRLHDKTLIYKEYKDMRQWWTEKYKCISSDGQSIVRRSEIDRFYDYGDSVL